MDHADFGLADSLPQFARDILRWRRTHARATSDSASRSNAMGLSMANCRIGLNTMFGKSPWAR